MTTKIIELWKHEAHRKSIFIVQLNSIMIRPNIIHTRSDRRDGFTRNLFGPLLSTLLCQ